MIEVLAKMPLTAVTVSKTKIGKGLNMILKNSIFSAEVNMATQSIVKKWKRMVNEHKLY